MIVKFHPCPLMDDDLLALLDDDPFALLRWIAIIRAEVRARMAHVIERATVRMAEVEASAAPPEAKRLLIATLRDRRNRAAILYAMTFERSFPNSNN